MDFTAYQGDAKRTAIYKRRQTFAYLIPAVADEALEVTDTPRGSDDEWDEMGGSTLVCGHAPRRAHAAARH